MHLKSAMGWFVVYDGDISWSFVLVSVSKIHKRYDNILQCNVVIHVNKTIPLWHLDPPYPLGHEHLFGATHLPPL